MEGSIMRVLRITRLRYIMFVVSILLIAAGISMLINNDGFNLGIDFKSGLSLRTQIAPEACRITYTGDGDARLNLRNDVLTLTITRPDATISTYEFPFSRYMTLEELINGMPGDEGLASIEGITVESLYDKSRLPPGAGGVLPTEYIAGLEYPVQLNEQPAVLNMINGNESDYISINSFRDAISELGDPQIQVIGKPHQQEFQIKIEDPGDVEDFSNVMTSRIRRMLAEKYGADRVLIKQTDYVGPEFSQELGRQVAYLTSFALLLILAYIWFRFQLAYAVAAIIALIHDVAIMLGFIGAFQIEVSTATMAAVLTIIGYSLNDTIVVFDRIRENIGLMRDSDFETVVNTSITQSLSRTLITSLTTMLAVVAIYIFATGSIKDFALNMIVGIIVGTYSSIFIASPVLMGWINAVRKKRRKKDIQKYGTRMEKAEAQPVPSPAAEKELPSEKAKQQPAKIQRTQRKLKGKRQERKKKK